MPTPVIIPPTPQELQAEITALTARVVILEGQGPALTNRVHALEMTEAANAIRRNTPPEGE